jgi:hypothetical protein
MSVAFLVLHFHLVASSKRFEPIWKLMDTCWVEREASVERLQSIAQ